MNRISLRRRSLLGAIGGGLVGVSGCVDSTSAVASGCVSAPPEDAPSAAEVREALPEYDGGPTDEDERMERIHEITDALVAASIKDHPWYCAVGREPTDSEWVVIILATCRPRARRYIPEEWGGVSIQIEQTDCRVEPDNN